MVSEEKPDKETVQGQVQSSKLASIYIEINFRLTQLTVTQLTAVC